MTNNATRMGPSPTFVPKYEELRELGYQQWEIAQRMGISVRSLVRQLKRHQIPVDRLAEEIAHDERLAAKRKEPA